MNVLVFTPTWNEAENIESLILEIMAVKPEVHLLVVDDHSPDGTGEIADRLSKQYSRLHVLHRDGPRGRGWAGIAAYIWALDHSYDCIVEMDADFSHQPQYIPDFIKALEKADMIIGSRYLPGGGDMRPGQIRRWISRLANQYQRMMFGTHIKDCTSGYRAYRAELLEKIGSRKLETWGPAILSDVLYRAIRSSAKITEIPIEFPDRQRGESTLTMKILWEGIVNVARLRFRGAKIYPSSKNS
ncbi:polyprenol monophosphomannose synthase [bacterium]|nr:polyprenol monophosphomannose synthase [candidate division CSSED10-310 bacterium]